MKSIVQTTQEQDDRRDRMFEEQQHISSKGFDNIVFVVSTGTFVISVTFVTGFSGVPLEWEYLLITSWVAFGLSIIFHALSYWFALEHAKLSLFGPEGLLKDKSRREQDTENEMIYKRIYVYLHAAFVLMVVGMTALVVFASANFLAANSRYKHAQSGVQKVQLNGPVEVKISE